MTELGRFRKYARRMRELIQDCTPGVLCLEALSVLQLCTINEPFLPNLETLCVPAVHGQFIPSIPLFLSPRTTSILFNFHGADHPKAMIASMITTFPKLCPWLQV